MAGGRLSSRKLFENVNSLFANESEFVIIGMLKSSKPAPSWSISQKQTVGLVRYR
jgi:hypothetical protein